MSLALGTCLGRGFAGADHLVRRERRGTLERLQFCRERVGALALRGQFGFVLRGGVNQLLTVLVDQLDLLLDLGAEVPEVCGARGERGFSRARTGLAGRDLAKGVLQHLPFAGGLGLQQLDSRVGRQQLLALGGGRLELERQLLSDAGCRVGGSPRCRFINRDPQQLNLRRACAEHAVELAERRLEFGALLPQGPDL